MEKKLEDMSKLADDIVLTEQNERKLFIASGGQSTRGPHREPRIP